MAVPYKDSNALSVSLALSLGHYAIRCVPLEDVEHFFDIRTPTQSHCNGAAITMDCNTHQSEAGMTSVIFSHFIVRKRCKELIDVIVLPGFRPRTYREYFCHIHARLRMDGLKAAVCLC